MAIPHPCIELSNLDMKDKMITMILACPIALQRSEVEISGALILFSSCYYKVWSLKFHLDA